VRHLIELKMANQVRVARDTLRNEDAASQIAQCVDRLAVTATLGEIRQLESQGSAAYWAMWQHLRISFPNSELRRIPAHWAEFGSRTSPVSNRPKKAANPGNAMLNYLYTVLATEARLALAALGLDPGLGLMHMDSATRDSLAYDLMEPVRPSVDQYLLRFLARSPLKREWFFEQRDGTCRLMPELAAQLGETALTWRAEILPVAEWFANAVRETSLEASRLGGPRTRLTRKRWKEVVRLDVQSSTSHQASEFPAPVERSLQAVSATTPQPTATGLGKIEGVNVAGRIAALRLDAIQRKRYSSQKQSLAARAWDFSNHPQWLTRDAYLNQIQPLLATFSQRAIADTLEISERYAGQIRNGTCVPHKRHWFKLAEWVGVSSNRPI
jgi:hypothetical protein